MLMSIYCYLGSLLPFAHQQAKTSQAKLNLAKLLIFAERSIFAAPRLQRLELCAKFSEMAKFLAKLQP